MIACSRGSTSKKQLRLETQNTFWVSPSHFSGSFQDGWSEDESSLHAALAVGQVLCHGHYMCVPF